jgi:hypothetical protein
MHINQFLTGILPPKIEAALFFIQIGTIEHGGRPGKCAHGGGTSRQVSPAGHVIVLQGSGVHRQTRQPPSIANPCEQLRVQFERSSHG